MSFDLSGLVGSINKAVIPVGSTDHNATTGSGTSSQPTALDRVSGLLDKLGIAPPANTPPPPHPQPDANSIAHVQALVSYTASTSANSPLTSM